MHLLLKCFMVEMLRNHYVPRGCQLSFLKAQMSRQIILLEKSSCSNETLRKCNKTFCSIDFGTIPSKICGCFAPPRLLSSMLTRSFVPIWLLVVCFAVVTFEQVRRFILGTAVLEQVFFNQNLNYYFLLHLYLDPVHLSLFLHLMVITSPTHMAKQSVNFAR